MKLEDPVCAEWYWNLYKGLACDVFMEIWNINNCFRFYFRDGDKETLIVFMLRDIIQRGVRCVFEEVYGDRKFYFFPHCCNWSHAMTHTHNP